MKYLSALSALVLILPVTEAAESPEDGAYQQGRQQVEQRTNQVRMTRLEQDHIKLESLRGTPVVNRLDQEIGTVADLIVDRAGSVVAVIVTTGGLMAVDSQARALFWNDLQVRVSSETDQEYAVVTSLSKQEFDRLPEFRAERRSTPAAR